MAGPPGPVNGPSPTNPAFFAGIRGGIGHFHGTSEHRSARQRVGAVSGERYLGRPVEAYRVWADIDLDALAHNLAAIRARVRPATAVMLVVKADAYGHGAVAVAHHALRCGVAALGVGNSGEALELRRAGVCLPILVLGTVVDEEAAAAVRHGVHIGLHSRDRCRMLQDLCQRLGQVGRVHLNVDTGWGQLGVLPSRAIELLEEVHRSPALELCGVMTHVASTSGVDDPAARAQIEAFERVLAEARERRLLRGWVHAANSACIFTGLATDYDAVRPGISAYGVLPAPLGDAARLRPLLSVRTQVVFLKDLPRGASVGYAGTWRAPRPTRIATLPVGYKDGLPFRLSNRGHVLVRGRRAAVVGRVSMDYTTVDVTDIPGVAVGDRVTLIGSDGDELLRVDELAALAGTIPYEITCAVGEQVPRVYHMAGDAPKASPADPDLEAVELPRAVPSARPPARSHETAERVQATEPQAVPPESR